MRLFNRRPLELIIDKASPPHFTSRVVAFLVVVTLVSVVVVVVVAILGVVGIVIADERMSPWLCTISYPSPIL